MINRKTVLIVSVDREVPVENIHRLREQIIDQINEGILVLPSWCTGTVADLDLYVPEPVIQLKESEPKKEGTKKKIDIDMGKVKALRTAGRTVEWIADDLGISAQTIYNRLKEEGDKNEVN